MHGECQFYENDFISFGFRIITECFAWSFLVVAYKQDACATNWKRGGAAQMLSIAILPGWAELNFPDGG
jgi:hypothetical protein